jgi:hypothetical protein
MRNQLPPHVWIIAGCCWTSSCAAVSYLWMSWFGAGPGLSGGASALVLATGIVLVPGLLGYWLVAGKRWVRWLFPLLIPPAAFVNLLELACPGLGPDADPKNCSGLMVPTSILLTTVIASIAVFVHFRRNA